MSALHWFELGVVAVIVVLAITIYNSLVALARRCDQAAADVDVQLRQRHDLIPNLVETVKGYAAHESGTMEAVIKARNVAAAATTPGQKVQAEALLGGAVGRLLAVAEAYPELKASANFSVLQDELSDIENKIAAARRYLKNATNEYNTAREQFPANILASLYGFKSRETVIVSQESRAAVEAAPAVRF
jgi:LemA protein